MKNTRKILLVLLALALLVPCFTVFASAEEATGEATVAKNYEEVLEYFEAGYFLNASFNNAATKEVAFADASSEFKLSVDAAFRYIDNKDGTGSMKSMNPCYFDITPDNPSSFGLNARIRLDNQMTPNIALLLHSDARDGKTDKIVKLFEIKKNTIAIYDKTVDSTAVNTVTLPAGTFFTVDFFYSVNGSNGVADLTIAVEGGETYTYKYDVENYTYKALDLRNNFVTADSIEIYKGSFPRELAGYEVTVGNHINELVEEYNALKDTDADTAFKCLEIAAKVLLTHSFDVNSITDEALVASVKANGETAIKIVGNEYIAKYTEAAAAIDPTLDYNARLDAINAIAVYQDFLKKAETGIYEVEFDVPFAEINVIHDKVTAEQTALATEKENTLNSLAAVAAIPDVYLANYKDLKTAYDIIKAHPLCATFYDENVTAEMVEAAAKAAFTIVSEYEALNSKAELFVVNMVIANDETKSFSEKYAAYLIAKANYFTDTSYNEYVTDTTVEALVEAYAAVDTVMVAVSNYAEAFIAKIDEANLTLSYSVKKVALEAAKVYLETVERQYPGVAEAIATYESLLVDVTDRIKATEDYIKSVIAVRDASTVADKKAAIAIAKELAVLGSEVSVDVIVDELSVKDANVILSNEESVIVLAETRIANYVSAVGAIATKNDLADRRAAINFALSLKGAVNPDESAIATANATLDAAIAAYNADIASANDASEACVKVALSTLAGTVPTQPIAQIVAIIKKYFD